MHIAVVAITSGGALLGQRLCGNGGDRELYVSSRYADRCGSDCHRFEPTGLKTLIASIWKTYDGIVLIMATGIVVRIIASLLESKETDPAVVVMDDAGRFAISLVSGHLGGANRLAEQCALASGACPVITTATDVNNLPSFDMLAKQFGWAIDDINRVKVLNTLLLDNKAIAVVDPTGLSRPLLSSRSMITYYETFSEAAAGSAHGFLFVTNQLLPHYVPQNKLLIMRPRNLVLGIGCNRGTPCAEIAGFVMPHLERLALSPKSISCIASITAKRNEAGLIRFAESLGVPFRCFDGDELQQVAFPSPPSEHVLAAVGVAAVAEPAAILASGEGRLLLRKVKSPNVTLAVAEINGGACGNND